MVHHSPGASKSMVSQKRCVVRAVWWVGLPWAPKRRPPPSVERPHSDLRSRTGDSQAETPEFEPHNTGTQNLIQNLNQDLVHIHKHRMRIECNDFSLLFSLLISFRNSQSLLKFFWTFSYRQLIGWNSCLLVRNLGQEALSREFLFVNVGMPSQWPFKACI